MSVVVVVVSSWVRQWSITISTDVRFVYFAFQFCQFVFLFGVVFDA